MPPKRTADLFAVPALPKKFRSGSVTPASGERTPPVTRSRTRSSSFIRAHESNETRRVVDEEWLYGRNKFGAVNTHLIVFEPGNQLFARVYSLCNKIYWRCMGCRLMDNKSTRAEFIDGDLYVPKTTFHRCRPKKYEELRVEQQKLENKFAAACAINEVVVDENENPREQPREQIDNNVQFNHPSSEWLREKCDQLGIQYSTAAYQLWAKCSIDKTTKTSIPGEVEDGLSTVFECLSMLFSGNEKSAAKIEKALNKNLSSKYKLLQKYKNHDFTKMPRDNKFLDSLIFADEATDFHLEFLARWFQCRLGIFEGIKWVRFGDWSSSDIKTITFLLKKENNKYHIVLELE